MVDACGKRSTAAEDRRYIATAVLLTIRAWDVIEFVAEFVGSLNTESTGTIHCLSFGIADPIDEEFDPEPCRPLVNWDSMGPTEWPTSYQQKGVGASIYIVNLRTELGCRSAAPNAEAGSSESRIRPATANQIRAIHAIANRQNLDLIEELRNLFGVYRAEELTLDQASQLIDAVKPSANGAAHHDATVIRL